MTRIVIPDGLTFSDLQLSRDPDGHVSFDWGAIEKVCRASDLPTETFRNSEDNIAGLLVAWYHAHLERGGERDAVADDLIAEAQAEDAAGQHHSHQPGRA